MSRPTGKDICWRQSSPLGQTGFLACASGICVFLLLVQQMGLWQHWSSWQLHPFSVFFRETVYSLLVFGPRSKSNRWVCTAAQYCVCVYIYIYLFPWKHAWCTANSGAFDTKAFVNWVMKLLPWCCVLESVGLIFHRRWLSSENFTCSQIIIF